MAADELIVRPAGGATHAGRALWRGRSLRCALGRAGIRADKIEGDGATPAGAFAFRRLLYRADRVAVPVTVLPAQPIGRDDGWCDDPADPLYNRPVRLPHAGRHERVWRDDALYDLVLVIGHNDAPVRPGLGSAVFVHAARPDFGPTEGCVAFAPADLLAILAECGSATTIRIGEC
jgi:L,D-peptidoglycan transpeptidase YkuD (ErfK/YbiS/YcfS/YnhG family)